MTKRTNCAAVSGEGTAKKPRSTKKDNAHTGGVAAVTSSSKRSAAKAAEKKALVASTSAVVTSRLPPSAPVSSLLPPIAAATHSTQPTAPIPSSTPNHSGLMLGVTNPAQLLSQYALLLQSSGALPQASTAVSSAVPTTSGSNAQAAAAGGANGANPLMQSLAQLVAAQAQATVAAQAAAAVAAASSHTNTSTSTSISNGGAPTSPTSAPAIQPHASSTAAVAVPSTANNNGNNFILPNGLQNWSSQVLNSQPVTALAAPSHHHHHTLHPQHHHHHHHSAAASATNSVVPHSFSLLLTEAQRRHEKKEAKRVANRKSASVSRARKKALVQEMTELNARLKRQALILALLPDLVIATDVHGVITFCSEQVERVLWYSPDTVVGSKLTELLVPSSRNKLIKLIQGLVGDEDNQDLHRGGHGSSSDAERTRKAVQVVSEASEVAEAAAEVDVESTAAPPPSSSGTAAAAVSDSGFPMSVVNVDPTSTKKQASDENDNSDTSASRDSKQPSSLTNSGASLSRSPMAEESSGNSRSDDASNNHSMRAPLEMMDKKKKSKKTEAALPSSDTSNTSSSIDADVKKLSKANANLERNVRWHNKKMMKNQLSDDEDGFKDDVIGAAVTANNASARLSSLRVQDRPETSSSEEDSGYRESNESREETSSSSASDVSESNGRRKPLAPTCNICLIRNDLTTVWCEVTSSVRTREPDEEVEVDDRKPPPSSMTSKVVVSCTSNASAAESFPEESERERERPKGVKEVLLCLRPIRDGEERVDEKYRFKAGETRVLSEDSNTGISNSDNDPSSSSDTGRAVTNVHFKRKAAPTVDDGALPFKLQRTKPEAGESTLGVDAVVAESLVLMSSKKT